MAFANTPFYPIVPLRSDGLFEVTTRSGKKEINGPSGAQLDATPDANGVVDCYERLDHNGTKGIDWRRKLAAMLIHHIGEDAHKKKEWILEEFPEGYTLWEQQKWNEKTTTKAKNKHAPGFYDRQDAYLYGHPQGKKRRYRSPAEFFPHLLWLCCDKDGDPNNCPCRLCSPKGGNSTADRADSPDTKEPLPPASNNVTNSSDGGKPIIIELEQNNTRTQTPTPKPTLKPGPQPPSAPPKAAVQSIIRSKEQVLDSQANGQYIYRPGELVWFNKGQAWGLSVIAKRQVQNDAPRYLVQPLSHPLNHPQAQIKEREDLLRPWLAWSVPATTNKAVATTPYDEVDWEPVRQQRYPGDPEVDGSILAAKVIDTSYSLFDRLDVPAPAGESHYNGMFLGAEKIWVGEPVRLKVPGDDIVVLIIQRLVERATPPSNSTVTFIGDVYKFVTMPMPYKSREEWPKPDLPPRMVADLQFRNEVADSAHKGQWCEWRLLEPAARRGLSDIKGRWYETRALLPILKGQQTFLQEISQGIASDVSTSMNGRGDSSQATSQRKKNRKDTLGQAVPADFKVSRGLDGPPSDDVFPDIMEIDGDQFYNGVNQ